MKLKNIPKTIIILAALLFAATSNGCFISSREVVTEDRVERKAIVNDLEPAEKASVSPTGNLIESDSRSSASANGINITLSTGIGGAAKPGDWLPVTVTVENNGKPLRGHIAVNHSFSGTLGSVYRQTVDLNSGSRKRLLFNILSNDFSAAPIEAAFVSNGKSLVKTTFQLYSSGT